MHFMEAVAEAVEAVERIPVVGPMIRIGTEVTGRVVFGTIHLVEGGVGLARSALGLGGHDGQVRSMEHHRVEVRSGRSKTSGATRATRPATAKRTSTARPKKSTAKKATRAKRPTAKRSTAARTASAPSTAASSATASSPERGTLSAAEAAEAFTAPES